MASLQRGESIGSAFPYRIERRIDDVQGNMSEVYLARIERPDKSGALREPVVLKVARVEGENGVFNESGLINEVEQIRSLTHPGIVHIYPIQQAGLSALPFRARSSLPGEPWFSVLEYLQGETLASRLRNARDRRLPLEEALFIARSLAGTLDYLHRCNVVHMDIKPENVLFRYPLTPGNRIEPVLIDFGMACEAGQHDKGGTPRYRAPERILVAGALAHPGMDIYALGVILYQMLTGRLPFGGASRGGVTDEILKGEITAPSEYYLPPDGQPGVREHLDGIIRKAMHRDGHVRYSASDLAEALEIATLRLDAWPVLHMTVPATVAPVASATPAATRGDEKAPSPPPPPKKIPAIVWTAGGAALLALLAMLGILAWNTLRMPPAPPTIVALTATPSTSSATPSGDILLPPATAAALTPPPLPTATDTPLPTPVPTATPESLTPASPTRVPTVTSFPTATPLRSTAPPLTALPEPPTPVPTPTPLPTSTPLRPTAPPPTLIPPSVAPFRAIPQIELTGPPDNARVNDLTDYCWTSNRPLVAGEAFEVFIWQSAHDWDKERLGIPVASVGAAGTTGNCVRLNLKAMIASGEIPREHRDPLNPDSVARYVLGEPLYWGVSFYDSGGEERWLQRGRTVIPE